MQSVALLQQSPRKRERAQERAHTSLKVQSTIAHVFHFRGPESSLAVIARLQGRLGVTAYCIRYPAKTVLPGWREKGLEEAQQSPPKDWQGPDLIRLVTSPKDAQFELGYCFIHSTTIWLKDDYFHKALTQLRWLWSDRGLSARAAVIHERGKSIRKGGWGAACYSQVQLRASVSFTNRISASFLVRTLQYSTWKRKSFSKCPYCR